MAALNVEASCGLDGRRGRLRGRAESGAEPSASQCAGPLDAGPSSRRYAAPHLFRLAHIDELVDALGPAQAGYGGAGLIP